MKAISSLVNVDSIDNDKNLEGGFSAESIDETEERMKNDLGFARQLRRVLKILDHSSIQAWP